MASEKKSKTSAKKIILTFIIAFFVLDIITIIAVGGHFFDSESSVSEAKSEPEPAIEKRVAIDGTAKIISPEDLPPSYHLVEAKLEMEAIDTDELLLIDDTWEIAYQDIDIAFDSLLEADDYSLRAIYWRADIENGDYNNGDLYPILKFNDDFNVYYSVGKQALTLPVPNELAELIWDDYDKAYYPLPENEYNELDFNNSEPLDFTLPPPTVFASFPETNIYIAIYDNYSELEAPLISMMREAYIVKEFYFDDTTAEYKFSPLIKTADDNTAIYDDFTITVRHYLQTDKVYIIAEGNELFMSAFAQIDDVENRANSSSNSSNAARKAIIMPIVNIIVLFIIAFAFVFPVVAFMKKVKAVKHNTLASADDYYQTTNDYSQQEFKQQEFAEHSYDDVHDYEEHSYSNDNSYEAYYQQEMKRAKEHKRQMSTKDKNGPFWIDD